MISFHFCSIFFGQGRRGNGRRQGTKHVRLEAASHAAVGVLVGKHLPDDRVFAAVVEKIVPFCQVVGTGVFLHPAIHFPELRLGHFSHKKSFSFPIGYQDFNKTRRESIVKKRHSAKTARILQGLLGVQQVPFFEIVEQMGLVVVAKTIHGVQDGDPGVADQLLP